MTESHDTDFARLRQENFTHSPAYPIVPGCIPSHGRWTLAQFAGWMGIEPETLKQHLEGMKVKCCIPFGRTTYVDAAAFNAGLRLQQFKRQKARGGGAKNKPKE